MSTTHTTRRLGTETGPWRTIDLMAAAVIGVTFGVVYWGWSAAYTAITTPGVTSALGPAIGLLGGPWIIAGVVGGFVVRRPGAALIAELLAATVEALVGNEWGWSTLISGTLQGLGVELALLLFLYRRYTWPVAMLAGALAAAAEMTYEWHQYWAGLSLAWKLGYLGCFMASAAVIAGLGGWALTRALAASGAIDALAAGREAARDHA